MDALRGHPLVESDLRGAVWTIRFQTGSRSPRVVIRRGARFRILLPIPEAPVY